MYTLLSRVHTQSAVKKPFTLLSKAVVYNESQGARRHRRHGHIANIATKKITTTITTTTAISHFGLSNSETETTYKNLFFMLLGMTEVVEGETCDKEEIHFKSLRGSLNRMSFASSPQVVAVNNLGYRSDENQTTMHLI